MTTKQDTNSNVPAEAGKSPNDVAQNNISSTSEKDALGDKSLDEVSGGLWPQVMTGSSYNQTI
jgi:hypothetical protein